MKSIRRVIVTATAIAFVAITSVLTATPAAAASVPISVRPTGFAHQFWNFDYDTTTHRPDNPVTIIFVSTKSNMVGRIYSQLAGQDDTHSGGKMTLEGWGGSRPGVGNTKWSSHSAGRKTSLSLFDSSWACWRTCAPTTDVHLRTYGPDGRAGTQVYQGSYGNYPYYVIGTTHYDVSENTSAEKFGYNDTARATLYNHMKTHGWHYKSSVWVNNKCARWVDSKHYCQSNGYAWVISID